MLSNDSRGSRSKIDAGGASHGTSNEYSGPNSDDLRLNDSVGSFQKLYVNLYSTSRLFLGF